MEAGKLMVSLPVREEIRNEFIQDHLYINPEALPVLPRLDDQPLEPLINEAEPTRVVAPTTTIIEPVPTATIKPVLEPINLIEPAPILESTHLNEPLPVLQPVTIINEPVTTIQPTIQDVFDASRIEALLMKKMLPDDPRLLVRFFRERYIPMDRLHLEEYFRKINVVMDKLFWDRLVQALKTVGVTIL